MKLILLPRIFCNSISLNPISSSPLKFIEPTIDAFKGKSDTRAKEVIDFPDPLSPTKESVVPLLILKFELIKKVLLPELFLKLIDKFLTDKTVSLI